MWSKGTVISVDHDLIEVEFENDSSKTNTQFWWYSPDIDIYNTKSEGDEWRADLKSGDTVDTFDSTKIWYGSTIMDRQIKIDENSGKEYLVLKIGFRLYHPEGNKEDNNKEKFFGWSESFDEWLPAYSPRIQKF